MAVSNLIGKNCKIYNIYFSDFATAYPNITEVRSIIDSRAASYNYFLAIPLTTSSGWSAMSGTQTLFNQPTLPTLPSNFNAEDAAKFDANIPNWQLASAFIGVYDSYDGTVQTEQDYGLFPNVVDISYGLNDPSWYGVMAVFDDEFAYTMGRSSSTSGFNRTQLFDLKASQTVGNGITLFTVHIFGGHASNRCSTMFACRTSDLAATNSNINKYNTMDSGWGSMGNSVLYGNKGSTSSFVTFLRYLDDNFIPPSPGTDDDPYGPGGTSGPGGGTGTFDGTSDPIDIPGLPTLSAADTGFITLFNPSIGQLKNLANYMWSDLFSLDTFKKMFADPMDAVLGLSIVPVAVPTSGTRGVVVGNIPTGVNMSVASTQYVTVDCGTLNVEEFWGAYLDYDPYTKCSIFLPYIGVHPIKTDDVMGKAVHVVYHVDILSGSCAAFVKCGESVLYEFIGQVASSIPITGDNFTNVINGVLNIAGSIGTMVATGGFSAPASVAKAGFSGAYQAGHMAAAGASMAQDVMSMKPQIEHSGSLSGTGGLLGNQTPYMILERPRQALPAGYNSYAGYPSHMTARLGSLSGYTEVEHIHLENIPCTMKEADEIMAFLQNGVIL